MRSEYASIMSCVATRIAYKRAARKRPTTAAPIELSCWAPEVGTAEEPD